jgi:hypothetical protein
MVALPLLRCNNMADQSQMDVNPFVQQYGQLRLTPMDTTGVASTSQDASSKKASGPAKVPSGKSPYQDPPGAAKNADPIKHNARGQDDGNYLPYLAGIGAMGAGAYAIKRYIDAKTGKMVEEVVPSAGAVPAMASDPINVVSGQVPDAVTRPNWRYDTPPKGGVPAVAPGRSLVPYVPPAAAEDTQKVIGAIARVLK